MKYILILAVAFICSCNSNSNLKHDSNKRDTTKTLAVYTLPLHPHHVYFDAVYRVIKDSFYTKPVNSWAKDTSYYLPRIDTLRDKNNNPIKDSLGNTSIQVLFYLASPNQVVHDCNCNVDSIVKAN